MPQARLPDINAAFTKYRNEAIISWKGLNYPSCIGSLFAFNGLLASKYRVKVSTSLYREKIRNDIIVTCKECDKESDFKTVKVFDLLLPMISRFIVESQTQKVWVCPKCNKNNDLLNTKMVQKVLQEPSFLQVVPNPPERKNGLLDRTSYHRKFSVWFWQFIDELEAQAAQFRDDNWVKKDNLYDDSDVDTEGEDENA